MSVTPLDPARLAKGGLQEHRTRVLPDGSLIEFEFAPTGYLKKDGEPRRQDWRAYFLTPVNGKRVRLVSVSSVLDAITPKPGLARWSEARGIEGCFEAFRIGELNHETNTPEDAVQRVRLLKLGADRARDDAAERGLNAHEALQIFMVTGQLPPRDLYAPQVHGYYQAVARWLLEVGPVPVEVEQLVASPADGYAGRSDLVATVAGRRIRFDAKTQERGQIFDSAHIQVALYEHAAVSIGDEPCDECRVVVFAANGEYRDMPGAATPATARAALDYYRAIKPVVSACDSANREARKLAA